MSVEEVAEALAAQGFQPCAPKKRGACCFRGEIDCHGEAVPVEVEIADFDFTELPKIRVLRRPKKLEGFQAHLMADDELCYADRHQVVLDSYHPAEYIAGCLKKASSVLEDLARKQVPNDTHHEFLVYWPGLQALIDCPLNHKGLVGFNTLKTKNLTDVLLISPEPKQTIARLSQLGWTHQEIRDHNCFVIPSDVAPCVAGKDWPPATIGAVLEWVRNLDQETYREIYGQLANVWILKTNFASFLVRTPTVDYGFGFAVDSRRRKTYKRKPSLYRDYLHGIGARTSVRLFGGHRFDSEYIHARNLLSSNKGLRNRSIVLVGCGTIGGYLATFLARLGAGQGPRGKLVLIDSDSFLPANLGRHVLGMEALFENKAVAVADMIKREFPYLNVVARPVDARSAKDTFQAELLIDTTGEEPLSMALNRVITERRFQNEHAPVAVYTWIVGAGVAAQSLLVDSLNTACYRCLKIEQDGRLVPRFGVLKNFSKQQMVRVGCDSYMPFPVSASVQSASLALELVIDWMCGNPTPRLRTRIMDKENSVAVKDQDASPLDTCLACRKR